ncbi:hypothetical protein Tco_0859269 [Tanacetum coccineum]|uniref:Xylulose kinase-1 n=1 Tax=Tanacetum coccineum TaxID=301880 RepID=A0ABQ5BDQ6_9ASTR
MVAYLKKPEGSEEFHQIVDFLNVSHIRYALTENPTIYVSFIKQLWQTATARTLDNGEIELTATIDGIVKTVTKASVRRHLQLADVNGISSLPTTKIFEQLSLMGAQLFRTLVADEDVHEDRGDSVERVATTATSLDAEQGSGNINRTQSTAIPNDPFPQGIGLGGSPNRQDTILGDRPTQTRFERFSKHSNGLPLSRVNTVGSGEDSMTLQELMVFCTTLSKKVESLETDLKRTKQLYGVAYTRLIKKGRKIDVIDQDPGISLVQHDAEIQGRDNLLKLMGSVVQGKGSTNPVESHHIPTSAPLTLQPPTLVADEDVHEDRGDSVERVATTATSLDAEQGSGNINRTQSTAIPNDPFPQGIGLGGSPNRQDTILGDRPTQTRFERFSKHSNGLPLSRVNTVGSGEDMESLETDLKQTKQIYGAAYTRLIKKVKKLEKTVKYSQARRRARIIIFDDEDDLEDPSKQGRKIAKIDQDLDISLVQHDAEIQGRYRHDMEFNFDFDAAKEVSTIEKDVSTAEPVSTAGAAVTTASVAVSIASPTRNTRVSTADDITMAKTLVYIRKIAVKDKAAVRLQAEVEEEERQRIDMVHKAASSFNVEEWEDIQARSLSIKERGGYTLQQLRGYSFDEIKTLLETTMRSVNTFVPIESEVDRAVPELAAGNKEVDEVSQEELQQMMIIVLEQGMNVKDLQSKYPIIDWEIYTEGTRKYWKIIRVRNHTEVLHSNDCQPNSSRFLHLRISEVPDQINVVSVMICLLSRNLEAIDKATTRLMQLQDTKAKRDSIPITPPSESAYEKTVILNKLRRIIDMQKNLALIAKYFKKLPTYNNNLQNFSNTRNKNVDTTPRNFGHYAMGMPKPIVKDSTYHKEKMLLCKQAEKGVQLQAEQSDWLADTDEEIDEQELEAHYSYMAKMRRVHNTCAMETGDSNVTPGSPDMCDNDIQDNQNDVECDDERAALANLISNLKLDVNENKRIQKQLKNAMQH